MGEKTIKKDMSSYINKIDKEMNSHYRIINSKNGTIGNFESAKMIRSLVSVGVPLISAFDILDIVTKNILNDYANKDLTTHIIRKEVCSSLYNLKEYDSKQCIIWGDVYLRKYGNPQGPIILAHITEEEETLDYNTLQDAIIIEILEELYCSKKPDGTKKSEIKDRIPKAELEAMGNELMRIVSDLGINRIHHRTLKLLAKDIATQPPHPWFIDPKNTFEFVQEEMIKTLNHFNEIESDIQNKDYSNIRHLYRECIYHISSAILGYYNEISGYGDLASFYHLIYIMNELKNDETNLQTLKESNIYQIKEDIKFCELTLPEFLELLIELKRYNQISNIDDNIEEILPKLKKYLTISQVLISGRNHLKNELKIAIESKDLTKKGDQFELVARKILELSHCFQVKKNLKIGEKQFDLCIKHKCKSDGFKEIKQYIFVECKNTNSKIGLTVVENFGKRVEDMPDRYCNTGILISANGFTKDCYKEANKYLDSNTLIILLNIRDLYEMIEGDIIKELEAKVGFLYFGF